MIFAVKTRTITKKKTVINKTKCLPLSNEFVPIKKLQNVSMISITSCTYLLIMKYTKGYKSVEQLS